MLVRNPEEEKKEKEKVKWSPDVNLVEYCHCQVKKPFKDSKASWYDDFVRNRKIITVHLHILHPAIRSDPELYIAMIKSRIRNILGICKDHLNYITMADCKHFRGDAIDLETFSGNIISGIICLLCRLGTMLILCQNVRRLRKPWWRPGIRRWRQFSMTRPSQRFCQNIRYWQISITLIMSSADDNTLGPEGRPSPELLQLCLCLAFHSGFQRQRPTFANPTPVPSWGTSWCAASQAMCPRSRWQCLSRVKNKIPVDQA